VGHRKGDGWFLKIVDERGSPSYLETDMDRDVGLYETIAFA